jgi:hypothetical protein
MTPETEVIACPACKHLVRVPLDWLGTEVQCPECKAKFRAPVRAAGKLTEPELISRPAGAALAGPKAADRMLYFPAFGLLLVGFAGLIANVWNTVRFLNDADAARQTTYGAMQELRKFGLLTDGPPEPDARAKFDEERAAKWAKSIRVTVPLFAVVSALVLSGGIAIVWRRHYRLAQLGCALAIVNFANGCCIPGAVFGLWGLLMLSSDEGRGHFLK